MNELANYLVSLSPFPVVGDKDFGPSEPLQEESGLPDWAIAVVVIGLGSFAFVLVFGITVVSSHSILWQEQGYFISANNNLCYR